MAKEKRTHLKLVVSLDSRYNQYRYLEEWLAEFYVHVTKVEHVDEDTIAVFYEKI